MLCTGLQVHATSESAAPRGALILAAAAAAAAMLVNVHVSVAVAAAALHVCASD